MDTISVCENSKHKKECLKIRQQEDIPRRYKVNDNNITEEAFPWLLEFNKIVYSSIENRNYQHLKRLLLFYTQKVLCSVEENNVSNPINLKNNINNILIFFHLYWLDIKQEIVDHSLYLNKMSALLSVYIDMELKTSRQKIEKILAVLYIYLNNSEEHIFRVLLRVKHMTEKYTQICNHIFMKNFTNLKIKMSSLTDVAYIRYLLVFKMWKKMEKISDKREKIDKLALKLLGRRMPKLRDELLEFVPKPTDEKNETLWLLKSNLFDLKETQKYFLLFEDKIELIDLTGDDESVPCKRKRKNIKHNLECSKKDVKNMNNTKHINLLKNSNEFMPSENTEKSSNKDNKSIVEKICLDHKLIPNNKNSDNTESYNSINNRSSLNNIYHINHEESEQSLLYLNVIKNEKNNTYSELVKEDETQFDFNSQYLKSPMFVDQNVKELKVTTKGLKESKSENHHDIPLHTTYMTGNARDLYNNTIMQSKETLTSQEESVMDTIPLLKMCQNDTVDQPSFKQEISINTNCNATQKPYKCWETIPHNIKHLTIKKLKSVNDHNSQITDYLYRIVQKTVCHQVNEYENCTKIDCKPFIFPNNNDSTVQEHNTFINNENDVKLACDTNIIYILRDCNPHYFVHHHIDGIMTCCDMHPENRIQCLHNSNDMYTVSPTFTEDQIIGSSLDDQNVSLDNKRKYDYGHSSKHSETMMKTQPGRNDCDTSVSNDQTIERYISNRFFDVIDTTDINSKEVNKMKTCCTNFENINIHGSKHFETTMKTQPGRNDCDTSMSNDQTIERYISNCLFDMDTDINSKEVNEMRTCCTDFENININFSHNQVEILEILDNVVSKETIEFLLSSKRSPFGLDNVNTFISEKDFLCNNQNNDINSNVNSKAFHLNNINDNIIL